MSALLALAALVGSLHGVVMRGPTTPVCQLGKPCREPAVGTVLLFSRSGAVVTRVTTGAGGRYAVHVAPGYYAVRLGSTAGIGRGLQPRQVRVRAGVDARLDFEIDTGIR
jgi:hypothetical protein